MSNQEMVSGLETALIGLISAYKVSNDKEREYVNKAIESHYGMYHGLIVDNNKFNAPRLPFIKKFMLEEFYTNKK